MSFLDSQEMEMEVSEEVKSHCFVSLEESKDLDSSEESLGARVLGQLHVANPGSSFITLAPPEEISELWIRSNSRILFRVAPKKQQKG